MWRFIKWVCIALAIVGIAGAAWLFDPFPARPSAEDLSKAAERYNAEIIRDDWGVPHIYGATDADTAFGIAYAHAEDDFETIQEVVAAGRGELSRYRGMSAAPTDYVVALLDVWPTIDRRYPDDVPGEVRAIAEAYAAGLNLYAAQNRDALWAGLAPFKAEDVFAGFILKTPFFYGFDETLAELFADSRDAVLASDPADGAWLLHPTLRAERGSNAFAVSPTRSGDGVTRLLINSHQPMTGPVAWWEAHAVSEEGWNMTGGLFPGTPIIIHGFNQSLGWANTVSRPDLTDIYRLETNPRNPRQYKLDGEWVDLDVTTVTLPVKLWGPFVYRAEREVLRSVHGPVIEAKHGTYAVRYAGMGEIGQLAQYYRLNRAVDWTSFSEAMALNALPSLNYVYADKDGNIAFIHNGQYPDRVAGWDWQADLPGDRSDLIWQDYLPYADGPKLVNPVSGFVFNANNTPYSATDGPDNIAPGDHPETLGLQTNETNRALRIMELTDGQSALSRAALLAIKFDTAYAEGSKAWNFVQDVLAHDWSSEPEFSAAIEHLRAWNFNTDIENRRAAIGVLTVLRHVTEQFTGDGGPPPVEAFREAARLLKANFDRTDPTWGEVNRLVRGELSLPVSGAPDVLRAIMPTEWRADGRLHAGSGDTWIALVEWDRDGTQRADVIHQYGAATLDESSPHYADQAELFVQEKWRSALLDRAGVEAAARCTYRPHKRAEAVC
ncbi:MAG: acylase [Pseudomonadota bacterium]